MIAAKTFLVIFLNITLFELHNFTIISTTSGRTDSSESEIFRGLSSNSRNSTIVSPYEYLRAHLGSIPLRADAPRIDYSREENVTRSSQEAVNTTEVYNDVPIAFPEDGGNIKIFGEDDQAVQHPLSPVLKPFLQKISGLINYLTHPNIALTPLYLLSMLKRKFVQHLRDKFGGYTGDAQEYPYPYKF